MYEDSSDEEEVDEDSNLDEDVEIFSLQTNPRNRHDSLREIVFLKDVKSGS